MRDAESRSLFSAAAAGDQAPWANYVPLAWRLCADPDGEHFPPMRDDRRTHFAEIAWWTPLFHLTALGSGWSHPFVGLARWDQLHRPKDEVVLQVVDRWWDHTYTTYSDGHLKDIATSTTA